MNRTISENGLNIIRDFEGCRLTAYKAVPSEKYYTIGYGHYGADVQPGMKITLEQAIQYLKKDIEKFEKIVNKYDWKYMWSQNEFDAMVSFAYNIGNIDQLTAHGTRVKATLPDKMVLYNKSGGKVLAGLTKRRAIESALFRRA